MTEFILKIVSYIKKHIFLYISTLITFIVTQCYVFQSRLPGFVRYIRAIVSHTFLICYNAYTDFIVSFIHTVKEYRIILFSLFAIISFIFILKMLIRLFRFFSGYIRLTVDSIKGIGAFLLQLGERSFYVNTYEVWKTTISLFMYHTLIRLNDMFIDYPLIQNPWQWIVIFRKFAGPLLRIIKPITTFSFLLINKWKKKIVNDKYGKAGTQADGEEKRFTSITEIPQDIMDLFSLAKENKAGNCYFPDKWLQRIHETIDKWKDGYVSNILIYGETGTGKTELLNYITGMPFDNIMVKKISLQRDQITIINKDLHNFLYEQEYSAHGKKQIILIDDLELLFIRNIEGFKHIKKLIHTIQMSGADTLWIISTNSSFYEFLQRILPLDSIFQYCINGDDLPVDALINIFHYKVTSIGYSFHILPDKQMVKKIKKRLRIKLISLEEVDINLKKLFFELYMTIGKGNIYFHFHYFLQSLKSIRGNKFFLNQPVFPELSEVLNTLTFTDLKILQSLFLHKTLSSEQLSEVLLLDHQSVLFSLQIMIYHNLIQKTDDNYCINRIHFNTILKFLKIRNIM